MATSNYYKTLSGDMKLRYDKKFGQCGGIDAYTMTEKDLSTNRNDFPEITLLDIGNHMIHSVSPFTKRAFKAYKSMEAYSFFESGFVLNMGSKKTENKAILKGKVRQSQRMNSTMLQVWVLAKMDGEIICAHCTCIAGLSETCSHVGAICFTVLNITESTETTSVTSLLCKWNVPKFNEVSMNSIQDIKWTTASYEEPMTSSQDPESWFRSYCDSLTNFGDEEVFNFVDTIHSDGLESALRDALYPNEIRRYSRINDDVFLTNLYSVENMDKTHRELVDIAKSRSLKISSDDVEEIARLTLPKHKSKFWVALRRGRVTESNLKNCCVTSVENPSVTTINRLINPTKNIGHIPSVKFQRKNKKKAMRCYVRQALAIHDNFKYQESGLVIDTNNPYFVASSDGFVSCDCHGRGCIEIKCFNMKFGESFDALIQKPKNILNKNNDVFYLEKQHELFYKAQMQIHLSELKYCDMVLWSPIDTLVLHINPDTNFWTEAKEKAFKFQQEVVMPELLGKFYTREKELPDLIKEDCAILELPDSIQEDGAMCLELIALEIEVLDSKANN